MRVLGIGAQTFRKWPNRAYFEIVFEVVSRGSNFETKIIRQSDISTIKIDAVLASLEPN
jgi:hypothetical protein